MQGSISYIQEKRAIDLVALHLSKVPYLEIEKELNAKARFDLIVRLSNKPSDWNSILAIEIKAIEKYPQFKRRVTFTPSIRGAIIESPSPICLFVVDVSDDSIYWCWLKEPMEVASGVKLQKHQLSNLPLEKSTKDSLTSIIIKARHYYGIRVTN